jgi:3-oxoacyl-[acyl-carrier-protein] synthase III
MFTVTNARLAGISTCVPKKKIDNADLKNSYGDGLEKVLANIGVMCRHVSELNQTTATLCFDAAKNLLKELNWQPDSVDALIFLTQTPNYQLPATACELQHSLGLRNNIIAYDINLGCSGYIYGLHAAGVLIASGSKRVLLLAGDTISKIVKPGDRSTELLFGDAGTASAIEFLEGEQWNFELGTDGLGSKSILAPNALTPNVLHTESNAHYLSMNGGEVFNFTLKKVPEIVEKTFDINSVEPVNIDYFIYHQANLYMLKHLAKCSKIEEHKMLTSIQDYGNTSSASIPLTICHKLATNNSNSKICMLIGFGVGLSWGGVVCDLSSTKILPIFESENEY